MFTPITQLRYRGKSGREHIWDAGRGDTLNCMLAGTVLGSETVRIRALRAAVFDEARYQLVDGGTSTLPYHSWIVTRGDEQWPEGMGDTEAREVLEPYLQGFAISATAMRLARPLASAERIYGMGEHTGSMDKRGQAYPIWNIDPLQYHGPQKVKMYVSIPFYLGFHVDDGRVSGVLIDHTGLVEMDMGQTHEAEASMTVHGDSLIAYFFAGPTPANVMRQYTELTGRMPLPPHWAIGYHQCRWGYMNEQEVQQVATEMRKRNHPCDAIWLDIDYMNGYRDFTWDAERFQHPEQLTEYLHAQGMRLVTIIDPGVKIDENYFVYQQGMEEDYFCRYKDGKLFEGNVWPGACVFPDFAESRVRTWWGNLYQGLLDQGVEGVWNDMNEPALTNMMIVDEPVPTLESNTMPDNVLHRAGGDQPEGPDGPPELHKFFHNAYGMQMAR